MSKFVFTDDQVKYIVENWGIESPHSMKKKFGCTWYAVCRAATGQGLALPESNRWTDEQIKELKALSEIFPYKEIASMMGKTENAIYLKAKKLGITLIQDGRKWTLEEEVTLKRLWGNVNIETIAKKLKRSVFSLKVKAVRMKLGPMILNNYDVITISDLMDLLNVTRDRIMGRWVSVGLKVKKKKLTKNKSYYFVDFEDLLEFLEENQYEWDSRNLEMNILGLEPEWLVEKRKRDRLENPLWYRRWTANDIMQVEVLFQRNKNYAEISEIVDRSVGAVQAVLRDRGYSYRLPQFWKGEELKYLMDNYQSMTYSEIGEKLGRTEGAVSEKALELGLKKRLINKHK